MDFNVNINRNQMKKIQKFGGWTGAIIGILFLLFILGTIAFQWITEYIWMDSIDFGTVFTTILGSKLALAAAGFVIFGFVTWLTVFWIRRTYLSHFDLHQLPTFLYEKKAIVNGAIIAIAVFAGLIGSIIVQGVGWEPLLKILNYETFGESDPIFNRDISFYMFVLPFLEMIINILLGLSFFMLVVVIAAYSVFHMYRMNRSAQIHLGLTIAIIGVLLAGTHLLSPFKTLLTNQVNVFQTSVVHGLSYTDRIINIPVSYVLAAVAVIGAIWIILTLRKGNINLMLIPIVAYIAFIILGQGVSAVVQNYMVEPNEFQREQPYLEHNLNYTRQAYDLENINITEHPGNQDSLDEEMLENNELTINNVRINDARPLLDIYNQLQTFRTYYQFNDIDVDRYEIDGDYQQVFIGARELNTDDLPEQAQTWVNQTLRYTHGYGIAMSQVNEVTSQGQPQYIVKNLPPEGAVNVERPQIYFGELEYPNVIVNSAVDEFDYPSGEENMTNRYEADKGIQLSGWNRLLFAINEGSFRMLVSDQLSSESQLLDTRNIVDRVNRIAPFFEYDADPYIIVRDDGTLAWIIDAYLVEQGYPYAENYQDNKNYIKNAAKVMIDAYTGEVNFFITEPEDPLLRTYQNIFPELFTTEIPEDVNSHFRYPERLFTIQANKYGTYHMTNLEIFYNREDRWEFPTEHYFNEDIEMEPYYVTMKLPEYEEEEFILMMPYTPRNRQNMVGWIGVRNDGEHYGEKFVYRFPKQENVYGPQQIENRINQDSVISQELNLWSQGGSQVIRGNLLSIPLEDTMLYVEPIYIESSNETSLPEVKQVVVAYQDYIVMEATFDEALERILELARGDIDASDLQPEGPSTEDVEEEPEESGETEESAEPEEEETPTPGTSAGSDQLLQEFSELFSDYQDALSNGNWEEAGEIMAEIEAQLEQANQ
ncbi:UPF0182 family protein [Oceanobacillus polygoni]|uniref:UPF0182 protein J2Z64_003403 n=1 Tax=Oceanobacillus polygoni TaxID=1235259 RepID=A0A9X0YVG0_9BACI|nr:UPF0182 family protein [Oceanobacillus polygoni]MBP2079132.1 uncharacterized membrane protein (UPF0182 family) [Oceanobacillus polygoni]